MKTKSEKKRVQLLQERNDAKLIIEILKNNNLYDKLQYIKDIKKSIKHLAICFSCKELFIRLRKSKQFCSVNCRVSNFRKKNR